MLFLSEREEVRLLLDNVFKYTGKINMAHLLLLGLGLGVRRDAREDFA